MLARYHKHLAQGTVVGLIGTVGMGVVNFFLRRHWALTLAPSDFGWFYINYSLLFFTAILVDLGGANYSVIAIAKHDEAGDRRAVSHIFFATSLYKVLSGIAGTVVFWGLAPWLAAHFFHDPGSVAGIRLMALFFPVFCLEGHLFAVLCSLRAFKVGYGVLLLKFSAILVAAMHAAPLARIPPLLFILGSAVACVLMVGYVIGTGKVEAKLRYCSLEGVGRNLVKGVWLAIFNISAQGVLYVDQLVATYLLGTAVVAVYQVAVPIMQILYSILLIIPTVGTPVVSAMWERDDAEPAIAALCSALLLVMVGLAWCALLVTVPFGNQIIVVLFSASFVEAGALLPMLSAGIILYMVAYSFLCVWNAKERNHATSMIMFLGPVLCVMLCAALIPRLGLRGAALAVFCAHLSTCLAACMLLKVRMPSLTLSVGRLFYLSVCGLVLLAPARAAGPVENLVSRQSAMAAGAVLLYLLLAVPAILPGLRRVARGAAHHPSS